ncbi:MAG: SLC13 family permease [Terricaulis sp.]
MTAAEEGGESPGFGRTGQIIGLVLGPACALGLQAIAPPEGAFPAEAWIVVSLAALMVVWWVTEAIPIAATALLPLIVLPVMGVASVKDAASPYADPIVFLFIGGFILAASVERWRLHERIALSIAARAGGRPAALVRGLHDRVGRDLDVDLQYGDDAHARAHRHRRGARAFGRRQSRSRAGRRADAWRRARGDHRRPSARQWARRPISSPSPSSNASASRWRSSTGCSAPSRSC